VTTLAGTAGTPGSVDGTGAAARFNLFDLSGVAVDSAGNVYVADTGNHTIRKVTPSGVVTALAGTAGTRGSADGTGAAARFNRPAGVAVDSAGNVYVADTSNHTIRKVTPAGLVVTTLAGTASIYGSLDATGAAARFTSPAGVAVDSAGNVYVADQSNHTIRKVAATGVVTTLAGTAGISGSLDGTGAAARFNLPAGMAVDSAGNIYVADTSNRTIRKVTATGGVTTLAGTAGTIGNADGTGTAASFNFPSGVAVDSAGNVYVADEFNNNIRKVTPTGGVTTLAGGSGGMSGSTDGTGAAARFHSPTGVAVDSAGNVYVADSGNHTIRKVTADGVVTTPAGSAGTIGSADGTGTAASFNRPINVAVDSAGNAYVTDAFNHTIRKVTPTGTTTTVAGTAGAAGILLGSLPRFSFPGGLVIVGDSIVISDTNSILLLRHGAQ
jgi:sugar lactone lactonase YvrE